jgi:hypothetical protein
VNDAPATARFRRLASRPERERETEIAMKRLSSYILILTVSLALILLATAPALGSGTSQGPRQTWPSRTPTSSAPQPTNPPGTQPPPEGTVVATPQPGTTPLATQPPSGPGAGLPTGQPSSGGAEPAGQVEPGSGAFQLPSASEVGQCGLPPIAVAQGPINVHSGPGIEFETIAQLAFQDERVIVGRAADAAWWQILLLTEQLGWVSDQAVTVAGYTGLVQITYKTQAGDTQPLWNPTPNPGCAPPSPEEIAISDGQLASIDLVDNPTAVPELADTPNPDDGLDSGDVSSDYSLLQPDDSAAGIGLIWLPVAGGLLIIAGGIALLVQRRQR